MDEAVGMPCVWLDERHDLCSVCARKLIRDRDNQLDIEAWAAIVGRTLSKMALGMTAVAVVLPKQASRLARSEAAIVALLGRVARLEELLGGDRAREAKPRGDEHA